MFTNYFLQSLKPGEEEIAIIHKHWIKLVPAVLRALVAFIIPSLFLKYILASQTASFIYLAFVALLVLYLIYSWVVYYFDVFIISDQRVIDVQQAGIFKRSVAEGQMSRIQDVTYNINGFFATLFNYGQVIVRTASSSEIKMDDIPDPEEVQEIIVELQKLSGNEKKMSAEELVEFVARMRDGDKEEPRETSSEINEDEEDEE